MPLDRNALPTLREVLDTIDNQPDNWLFLPSSEQWSLDSPCAILDTSDLDDDDDTPPEAKAADLMLALSVSQVQDIIHNAKAQLGAITAEQGLEGFLYYYDNDAFKDFGFLYVPSRFS